MRNLVAGTEKLKVSHDYHKLLIILGSGREKWFGQLKTFYDPKIWKHYTFCIETSKSLSGQVTAH
jgi:hypothetical protein